MSDLVKRLRDYDTPLAVKERAATAHRIERLEAFVAKVRASKSGWHDTYSTEEVDQALAELDE